MTAATFADRFWLLWNLGWIAYATIALYRTGRHQDPA